MRVNPHPCKKCGKPYSTADFYYQGVRNGTVVYASRCKACELADKAARRRSKGVPKKTKKAFKVRLRRELDDIPEQWKSTIRRALQVINTRVKQHQKTGWEKKVSSIITGLHTRVKILQGRDAKKARERRDCTWDQRIELAKGSIYRFERTGWEIKIAGLVRNWLRKNKWKEATAKAVRTRDEVCIDRGGVD